MDPAALEVLLEATERDATLDLVAAAPPQAASAFSLVARPFAGGALLVAAGLPTTLFNRVFAAPSLDAAQLAEAAARFRAAHVASWHVQVAPAWLARGAETALAAAGMRVRSRWVKMWHDRAPPPDAETDLRVSPVPREDAAAVGRVACAAFGIPSPGEAWLAALVGRPHWRVYGAYERGALVACGAVWIGRGVALMGVGGTLPSHRRRGAQLAIMARRVRDALDAGCDLVVTETGAPLPERANPSYANMLRCGFRLAYERVNFGP